MRCSTACSAVRHHVSGPNDSGTVARHAPIRWLHPVKRRSTDIIRSEGLSSIAKELFLYLHHELSVAPYARPYNLVKAPRQRGLPA